MYRVFYYRDREGRSPIEGYFEELAQKSGKDSRINLNKFREYVRYLSEVGLQAGEPYIKHIEGDIWELRPIRNRIFFAAWDGQSFILLHHFVKKTQRTPSREIETARRNLADYRERGKDDEQ